MVRSILVGLDESPYSQAAVTLGLEWAKRFDCLLVGIGVVDEPSIRGPRDQAKLSSSYKNVYDGMVAEATRRVDRVLEQFTLQCAEAGVASKLLEDVGSPSEQIMTEAQRYDLIMIGQKSFFQFETTTHECETLDRLLHATPRPVVVVPKELRAGSGVLVAYDGSLQATRALQAFAGCDLSKLGEVHVLSVHGTSSVEASKAADRAVEFLRFHDVQAVPHAVASKDCASDTILSTARQTGAGLIVMGSYGRSVFVEFFLGSATRNVLKKTDVPLFVYH